MRGATSIAIPRLADAIKAFEPKEFWLTCPLPHTDHYIGRLIESRNGRNLHTLPHFGYNKLRAWWC
jgi:hypothetical protein